MKNKEKMIWNSWTNFTLTKSLFMICILFGSLIALTSLNVKAASGYRLTVEYDSTLASVELTDAVTNTSVQNGDILPVNENGWTTQVTIEFKIRNGYRIKKATLNGVDVTDSFIEGGYGGLSKAFDQDTVCKLTLEEVPSKLPSPAGAEIIGGKTLSTAYPIGNMVTFDDSIFKLWAKPAYTDGVSYPKYYVAGNWQFSLDGEYWYNCNDYGWTNRTDFWPEFPYWPPKLPINFVTQKNYYLRIQLNGRKYYSVGVAYSDAIFVNSDGTVKRKDIKNPTESATDSNKENQNDGKTETTQKKTVAPAKGTKLTLKGVTYKVTTKGKAVQYLKGKTSVKTAVIPATVKIKGITYKITSIAANAFKGNKKLTSVTIGKNIITIGKQAFYGCKNLKKITISTTKLTTKRVGASAFKGIHAKATVKCPKNLKSKYKKLLLQKGMKKTVKFS